MKITANLNADKTNSYETHYSTLTASADDFSPNSQAPNSKTTAGNDLFLAGSVQGGGAHTLGAADNIDGGAGDDTIKIVEDRSAANSSTLFPRMTNVERVEIQALTAAEVDFNNTSGIKTLVSDRSIAATTVTNLRDNVKFELNNTNSEFNVGYSTINPVNPTSIEASLNSAQGAALNLTNQGAGVTTLTLNVNGGNTVAGAAGGTTAGIANTSFGGLVTGAGVGSVQTLDLNGASNVVVTGQTGAGGLTQSVSSVDSTGLTGSLNINLLGQGVINNTFTGGNGNTRLVQTITGDDRVTFGSGNDLLIVSSIGLDGADVINGGAGLNALEVHYNNTNRADALAGTYAALASASNVQGLVVDVWTQTDENVAIDQTMLVGVAGVTIQDTSSDLLGAGPGNGTRDGDLSGTITLTNTSNAVGYALVADVVNTVVASGTGLNLALNGFDNLTQGGSNDDSIAILNLTGLTGAANVAFNNIASNNLSDESTNIGVVGSNTFIRAAGASTLADVQLANNGVLNLSGSATNFTANVTTGNDITINAAGVTTQAGLPITAGTTTPVFADNVINATGALRATITGSAQNDNITGTADADRITTGEGNNTVSTGDGNDVVIAGSGTDVITVGNGEVNVSAGAGNDRVVFASQVTGNLTSADIVDGGAGRDTLAVTTATTLLDGVFNQITNVEVLDVAAGSSVTFNAIANARAFDTINLNGGNNTVMINEGFARNNLTVQLGVGSDSVTVQALSPTAITVAGAASRLESSDSLNGGTSAGDKIVLTADNGTADMSGVRGFETVELVSAVEPDGNAANESVTLVVGNDAVVTANSTLTITAAGLVRDIDALVNTANPFAVIDASAVTTAGKNVNVTGSIGDDTVFASAGNDVIDTGAGNDVIYGGMGTDRITVNSGDNLVTYANVAESRGLVSQIDTIVGFTAATLNAAGNAVALDAQGNQLIGDRIVIDTTLLGGNTLSFGGNALNAQDAQSAVANVPAGQTRFVFQTDENILWVDLNRDGTLNNDDLRVKLEGVGAITQFDVTSAFVQTTTGVPVLNAQQAIVAQGAGQMGYDIRDTAPNLAALSAPVANAARNLIATTVANVAQAVAIDGFTNTGTNTYDVTDTAANLTGVGIPASTALSGAGTVRMEDTGANIANVANSAANFANVDVVDATDNVLSLTVVQLINNITNAKLTAADTVTVFDTGANITLLSATDFGNLTNVDFFDASNDVLSLSVAQANAITNARLTGADAVTVSDTGANIQALTAAQLTAFTNVDFFNATNDMLSLSVAQANAITNARLTGADTVTVSDTGANIQALTAAQLAAFTNVDTFDASNDVLSLSVAQANAITNAKLVTGDAVTVLDTGANIVGLGAVAIGAFTNVDSFNASDDVIGTASSASSLTIAIAQAIGAKQTAADVLNVGGAAAVLNNQAFVAQGANDQLYVGDALGITTNLTGLTGFKDVFLAASVGGMPATTGVYTVADGAGLVVHGGGSGLTVAQLGAGGQRFESGTSGARVTGDAMSVDTMLGNTGIDTYVVQAGVANIDVVENFNFDADQLAVGTDGVSVTLFNIASADTSTLIAAFQAAVNGNAGFDDAGEVALFNVAAGTAAGQYAVSNAAMDNTIAADDFIVKLVGATGTIDSADFVMA